MNKKTWKDPKVSVARFMPNEYISSCTVTESYYRVYAPVQETNGIDGWQEHNAPAGSTIDTNGVNADGWFRITDMPRIIYCDDATFADDDNYQYYMFTLTQAVTNEAGTKTYNAGQVLYKNYNSYGNIFYYEKNAS